MFCKPFCLVLLYRNLEFLLSIFLELMRFICIFFKSGQFSKKIDQFCTILTWKQVFVALTLYLLFNLSLIFVALFSDFAQTMRVFGLIFELFSRGLSFLVIEFFKRSKKSLKRQGCPSPRVFFLFPKKPGHGQLCRTRTPRSPLGRV